jgi:ubiquinone/menaquinone biosynthesis C-methylase UbiE
MIEQAAHFAGTIPENYDSGLGPHLFVDIAADLARRAVAAKPGRVLETAAGTGIVTRFLRDALPDSTHLIASDLNPPMLAIALRKFGATERVEFQPADAAALPFVDGTFDAIVCQFGVMFFADKDLAYREAYRVLGCGGRYHFNVWDSFDFNPFARISHDTIAGFSMATRRLSSPFRSVTTASIRSSHRCSPPGLRTFQCMCSRSTKRSQRPGSSPKV